MWIRLENTKVECIIATEMKGEGWIEVDSIPTFEEIEDKVQILHYSAERGFWAEYEDVPEAPQPEDNTLLENAIRNKVEEIEAYDKSENVNAFFYGGEAFWLDKDTRVGLVNSTNMLKQIGETETTLWLGNFHVTIPCDSALQMLCALEVYALQCYNTTAQHKANVGGLCTLEEVEQYDYTAGYPEKLRFDAIL